MIVAAPGAPPAGVDPSWLADRGPVDGRPAAYLCRGTTCSLPIVEPEDLSVTRARDNQRYGSGHDDGLDPLTPLDLAKVDGVDALVRAMSRTAFGGRRLGEAADVLEAMVRDRAASACSRSRAR